MSKIKLMLTTILFDLDNTLIDFMQLKESSIRKAVKAMQLDMDEDKAVRDIYKIYKKKGMEDKKVFQEFLRHAYKKIDYKKLAKAIIAYRKERQNHLRSYPGVKDTLRQLKNKNLKLAIITDAPKIKAYLRLSYMNIEDYFDLIITDSKKPSRDSFEKALKRLKSTPEQTLMVGDSIRKDINAAKRLKINTYKVNTKDFKDVLKVIKKY